MPLNLCFLMPGPDSGPVGGYKVVYEYANRLVADGCRVTIVFPLTSRADGWFGLARAILRHPRSTLLCFYKSTYCAIRNRLRGIVWFDLDPRVKRVYPVSLSNRFAHQFAPRTRFISTYMWTSERLNRFTTDCRKFQFLQGYEAWDGYTPEMLSDIYRYPMTKIAISEWLCAKVREAGSEAVYIPNGLDFKYFKLTNPIEGRKPTEVAMLWHEGECKRTKDAVSALEIVRTEHQDLHITAFGVLKRPNGLPDWITYIQCPNREMHNAIYNNAAIFVASSEQEGWGLTPCEAMQCGAAVACTDIGGYRSFASNGETALMSPARDVKALATNICRLIDDDALRIEIAKAGYENVQQFTWEQSVCKMLKAMV